ncbi:MAG: hypothetical protein PGN25_16545 [Methylorubrum populi]
MTESVKGDGLRTLVALIEIQGGLVGLWAFLQDLMRTAPALPLTLLPGVLFIGLVLAASVVAGVALWQDRRLGYTLSVPVQLAQVIWFVSASLTVRVSASGWLLAEAFLRVPAEGGVLVGWQFDAARKGGYALTLAPREDFTLALNLIALAILVWLGIRLRRLPPRRGPSSGR